MKKISIIIPAYNEERTIAEIIDRVQKAPINDLQKEIIVVDNGSNDQTPQILKNIPGIKVLKETAKGKGFAVKSGLQAAEGDWLFIQDADLEYNPNDIQDLIAAAQDDNVVVYGSRNLGPERKGGFIPRAGVWFLTKQFNFLFDTQLTDLWTCYKLFPRKAASLFEGGGFDSELSFSAKLAKAGFVMTEVPISYNQPRSKAEGKKIRYRDGIWGIVLLIKKYFTN